MFLLLTLFRYGLIMAQIHVSETYGEGSDSVSVGTLTFNGLMGIPVALVFVIGNTLWNLLSLDVTRLERRKRWAHFRFSRALKTIVFKICTTTLLYDKRFDLQIASLCFVFPEKTNTLLGIL